MSPCLRNSIFCLVLIAQLPNLACDILNPRATPVENQLTYINIGRSNLQALNRWWPWLAPQHSFDSAPLGQLPFHLPETFSTSSSEISDFQNITPVPDHFFCDITCTITWNRSKSAKQGELETAAVFVSSDNMVTGGTTTVRTDFDARWELLLGKLGKTTSATIRNNELHPIKGWNLNVQHSITQQVDFTHLSNIKGMVAIQNRTSLMSNLNLELWSDVFFWAARPSEASIHHHNNISSRSVLYANGLSTFSSADLAAKSWQLFGPGIARTTVDVNDQTWTLGIDYESEQALQQIKTTIVRHPVTGPLQSIRIVEEKRTRLGGLNIIEVSGDVENNTLRLIWSENSRWFGTVDISKDELSWQIEAFWDSEQGDFIEVTASRYLMGFWAGTLSGWAVDDRQQPTESGEWVMTLDGTTATKLLFKQANDSIAELPLISPPEGASRLAVE